MTNNATGAATAATTTTDKKTMTTSNIDPSTIIQVPYGLTNEIARFKEAIGLNSIDSLKCMLHGFARSGGLRSFPIDLKMDVVAYDLPSKIGPLPLVVFRSDGTADVVELRNGDHGYEHVCNGIGKAGMYAVQLAEGACKFRRVRRALAWTATGNAQTDTFISIACEKAGIVPMLMTRFNALIDSLRMELAALEAEARTAKRAAAGASA